MATIQEKIDALRQELGEVVEQHNQAVQIQTAAKEKAISIQGAIEALKELLDGEEAPAEAG
jgi:small-conductance mechanosensitive channel